MRILQILHYKRSHLLRSFHCIIPPHGNQLADPSQPPSKKRKMTPSICNCGRSTANPTKKFCTLNDDGYSSRCPCLKSESGCVNCMCKCCDNPFGVNKSKTQPTRSWKREKAELSMKRETGQGFMTQAGEEAKKGPWSDVETLLLFTLLEQNNAVNTIVGGKALSSVTSFLRPNNF